MICRALLTAWRCVAAPTLLTLYILAGIPLFIMSAAHRACWLLDEIFDALARSAGWDPRFFPLPKSSDEYVRRTDITRQWIRDHGIDTEAER